MATSASAGRWRASGIARGAPYALEGEFLEVDPPRKLVQTWHMAGHARHTVDGDLFAGADRGGTRLTVRHAGIAAPDQRNNVGAGWRSSFDRLSEILPTPQRLARRWPMTKTAAGAHARIAVRPAGRDRKEDDRAACVSWCGGHMCCAVSGRGGLLVRVGAGRAYPSMLARTACCRGGNARAHHDRFCARRAGGLRTASRIEEVGHARRRFRRDAAVNAPAKGAGASNKRVSAAKPRRE